MIEVSDQAAAILAHGSYTLHVRAESWLDETLLADEIPIADGSETVDRSLRVPERVTLTVPRTYRGASWAPNVDDHPLAANGQRIRVEVGIGLAAGRVEWLQRGWFLIYATRPVGDTVQVECQGMLTWIDEARLVSPFQPTGAMIETLRGLVEPALTVSVDVADRAVPSGINFSEDRLGAVLELLDAWPADAVVGPDGVLQVSAVAGTGLPVLTLTDGAGGTVVEVSGASTREGAANVVVARGTAADGTQVQGAAYLSTGPKAYGGPFNPLPVPSFFPSPLLTTTAQARAAASTVLARRTRGAARMLRVEAVPHPALLAGDVVQIVSGDYTGPAVIDSLSLPYTADSGPMVLMVRAVGS